MPQENILNKLNEEQKNAVIKTDGPTTILAGAGSGKTRVLVYKVLYLITEKNIDPLNILMVTFTNKAAGEMTERITNLLQKVQFEDTRVNKPTIGTFHSLCARILRRSGQHIGIPPNFLIFDEQDQLEMVKQAQNALDISTKQVRPRSVLATISQAKNEMITPAIYSSFAHGFFQEAVSKIYPLYQNLLKESYALDFDDLLLETIRLFKENKNILSFYQDKFLYILVDEYQDTNKAQFEITNLLSEKNRNICIVGDFSQSIYGFRGADYRNLEKFKKNYKDAKVFSLSQNYRSSQKILDAAFSVIQNNKTHPVLSLWTENKGGENITIFEAETEHQEAEYIVGKILEERMINPTLSYSDFVVLYRMNAQSRVLEEVFLHNSTPYVLIGGVRFYERKEIKDILALLMYLSNPKSLPAIKRIQKIGKRKANLFLEYTKEFADKNYIASKPTIEIMDEAIQKISYLSLYDENVPEEKSRIENIKELRSVAIEFPNLIQFLENVSLVEQEYMPDKNIKSDKPNAITLMTLHAAKGLEFKNVFMVGMEEGIFPHSQSLLDTNEIEEERRLCYVGITRAREKLFLTYSKRRLFFGQRTNNMLSRFILELPKDVLDENFISTDPYEPEFL